MGIDVKEERGVDEKEEAKAWQLERGLWSETAWA